MLLTTLEKWENTPDVPNTGKVAATVSLTICAIALATFAGYSLSILWSGQWKYPELVFPTLGTAAAAILAVTAIAFINRRHRGNGAILRMTALLTVGCGLSSAGIFFFLLANCRLSCSDQTLADVKSPDGQWRAVWYSRKCVAKVGYCPTVSYVSIVAPGEQLHGEGNAFSIVADDGVQLDWKSNNLLRVSYSGLSRGLNQKSQVRGVHIEYVPIGIL